MIGGIPCSRIGGVLCSGNSEIGGILIPVPKSGSECFPWPLSPYIIPCIPEEF